MDEEDCVADDGPGICTSTDEETCEGGGEGGDGEDGDDADGRVQARMGPVPASNRWIN